MRLEFSLNNAAKLKPPSEDIIDGAVTALVNSIRSKNPSHQTTNNLTQQHSFENEINILTTALIAIGKNILTQSAAYKKRYNDMLPVHQLPSELLSSILLSASRQDAPQKLPRRSPLHRLAAVSYRWWKTVTLSPIFWTDITSRLESDVGLYLRKSQDAPLNIKCFAGYCNTRTFVETVAGAAHRWRSITLHYNSEDLLDNLPSAMPQLTDMQISTPGGSQSSVPRNILNLQGLVKLRHLCLRNVGFHWENLELEGLLSLRLCRLQHTVPNFTWITAVLQRSPQLQHLALRELEILPESVHTTPTEIQLLQLKSLQLSEVREGISRYLLSTIYSPNLKAFQFVEYIDPRILGYDEILCQAVLKRCIPSVLQNLEKITIRSRSSGTEIEVTSSPAVSNVDDFNSWTPWATSPDSGGLYILFFNHDYTLSENPVITMLSESGLEKATRGEVKLLIQSGLGGRFNPLLLDKLPTLTTLAATNSTDVRGILRHLGECRMQHGTWSYPCPRLETLDIRWANEDVGQGDVDTFFVTRYADGKPFFRENQLVERPPSLLKFVPPRHVTPIERISLDVAGARNTSGALGFQITFDRLLLSNSGVNN